MTDLIRTTKEQLFLLQDSGYRDFQSSLLPTVLPARIIGVRVPALRHLAKEMTARGDGIRYLKESTLPHSYYDEDNLHAFLIEALDGYDVCMDELQHFLPYIDNWATCDMLSQKVLLREPGRLYQQICLWLRSDHIYTVRFAVVCLLRHYLDARFSDEVLRMTADIRQDDYYLQMAAAWCFAEALAKQYDAALPYLTAHCLPAVTHNKAIQKALESRRIPAERKAYLRTLKRRGEDT
ncbi:MAG: DNA alkylation repair protein [Clostridia bacterium]|nr:DNA alkylation repair protein [Clostridia bacterium]